MCHKISSGSALLIQMDNESELLSRLAAGDPVAFSELYDHFALRLHRTFLRLGGSRSDADDLLQDLFLQLVRSRNSLSRVRNLTTYLFSCAFRLFHKQQRNKKRTQQKMQERIKLDLPRSSIDPAVHVEHVELARFALRKLTLIEQQLIVLKIDGELTFAELGEVLSLNPNTIATRYRTALVKMKGYLEGEGYGE